MDKDPAAAGVRPILPPLLYLQMTVINVKVDGVRAWQTFQNVQAELQPAGLLLGLAVGLEPTTGGTCAWSLLELDDPIPPSPPRAPRAGDGARDTTFARDPQAPTQEQWELLQQLKHCFWQKVHELIHELMQRMLLVVDTA